MLRTVGFLLNTKRPLKQRPGTLIRPHKPEQIGLLGETQSHSRVFSSKRFFLNGEGLLKPKSCMPPVVMLRQLSRPVSSYS